MKFDWKELYDFFGAPGDTNSETFLKRLTDDSLIGYDPESQGTLNHDLIRKILGGSSAPDGVLALLYKPNLKTLLKHINRPPQQGENLEDPRLAWFVDVGGG